MSTSQDIRAARVVVTGLGVVTAIGVGRAAFARALRAGERGMGPVTLFDVSDQKSSIAAEVKDFDPASVVPTALREIASRSDALGIVAADEALRDAQLSAAMVRRAAIVVGGTTGGMLETESFLAALHADPSAEAPIARLLSHPLSTPADHVARALGIDGPRRTICTACSSSANALAVAAEMLRRGECDVALAGGTDALCRLTYSGFNALGAIDPRPCRPFDVSRAGLNLGEGAAFVVLERMDDAARRGAHVVAELLGVGIVSEAHHITNPQATGEGAARAMALALRDAGLEPTDVDYVNAHGTGTSLNDPMESRAIRAVLGAHAERAYVSSTKSMVGHTLGAAGAIEVVASLLAMQGGFVPPTAGLENPDPACSLRHVPRESVPGSIGVFLSNSFGFGGTDTVVCLGRPEAGDARVRARARVRPVVITGLGALLSTGSGVQAIDAAISRAPGLPATAAESSAPRSAPSAEGLDPARARRLDRFARLATGTAAQCLSDAGYTVIDPARVGAALGTAWGSLDASAAFMRRVIEKGARLAPPADFPNLVLSAAVGHLSIYHGFKGPTLTAAALAVSGEAAIVMAAEEIISGRADAMTAGGVEERNDLVLRALEILAQSGQSRDAARAPRAEGAACIMLEAESAARARGARPLARLVAWHQATFAPTRNDVLSQDGGDAIASAVQRAISAVLSESGQKVDAVVVPVATPALRDGITAALGAHPALHEVAPRAGFFEAIGALAVAAGVRLIARGEAERGVVVVGTAPGAAYALLLIRP